MTIKIKQKATNLIFLILVVISCSDCLAKAECLKIIQTENSLHYYFNKPDNKPHEGIIYTRIFSLYRYPNTLITRDKKEISYKSTYETVMIDCGKQLITAPDTEYYADTLAKKGTEIYFDSIPPDHLEWLTVDKNPVFNALYKKMRDSCL